MVFDKHQNGVPVAWVITSSSMECQVRKWLSAVKDRMVGLKPKWQPSCFLVDDSRAEIAAIRQNSPPSLQSVESPEAISPHMEEGGG